LRNKNNRISIIDTELTVEGKMVCRGMLLIRGTVRGTLKGDTIIIDRQGAVYAEMEGKRITIGGIFEGKVSASSELILLPTGSCSGKVVTAGFIVEAGGILNAEVESTTIPQ
jgi:cytoskeletal protein CcmA (bactofilin family)